MERAKLTGRQPGLVCAALDDQKKIRLPEPTDSPFAATDLAKGPSAESQGPIPLPTLHGSRTRLCPNSQNQNPLAEMVCDLTVLVVSGSCPKRWRAQFSKGYSLGALQSPLRRDQHPYAATFEKR